MTPVLGEDAGMAPDRPAPALVRPARPREYAAVGDLTARAYLIDGHGSPSYAERLRNAGGRAAAGDLLVAVEPGTKWLLGTVTLLAAGADYAEISGRGEMEIRMLAVDHGARGRGVGTALAIACLARARSAGATAIRLSTEPSMRAAHRIYERLGFRRTPDRDWSPTPGVPLLTYSLDLGALGTGPLDRRSGT